jgi:limonene-1,2-epoxide hydrolase
MNFSATAPDDWSPEEHANVAVVRQLMAALVSRDAEAIAATLAPDALFTMGPIGALPPRSRADFVALLAGTTSIEIDVRKTFASGPIVMMDRFDRLVWPDRTISGRWIGIIAVKDGRVVEFTDYTIERSEVR